MKTLRIAAATLASILLAAALATAAGFQDNPRGLAERRAQKAATAAAAAETAQWVSFTNAVDSAKNLADLQAKLKAWGQVKKETAEADAKAKAATEKAADAEKAKGK